MSAERAAAAGLADILGRAGAAPGGVREVVRTLDLASLASLPVLEIYAALVDVVCPPDGTLDDAHAREAYLEAVAEMTDAGQDLERPSQDTARDFIGCLVTNAVHLRILNAIANGIVSMPSALDTAMALDAGLKDFIRSCVTDGLAVIGDVSGIDAFRADVGAVFARVVNFIEAAADDLAEGPT